MTVPKTQPSLLIPILIIVSALVVGTVVGIFWVLPELKPQDAAWIAPSQGELQAQGKQLYQQHCASCHGVALQGQENWRTRLSHGRLPAPPHNDDGHTWHHPDQELVLMIKKGLVPGVTAPEGYQSDMPAYENILSDQEIQLILAYIKSQWSPKSLAAQREITLKTLSGPQ